MKQVLGLIVTLMTVVCGAWPSSGAEVSESKPTLIIEGVIARGNILPLGERMLTLASKGEKEVQLIINSPGGQVTTGFMFISMMNAAQSKGLKVTCFVPALAASMAYQILLHCDERHSLNGTFLLWHRARITFGGGMMSQPEPMQGPALVKIGNDLLATDSVIFRDIVKAMGDDVEVNTLKYHFEAETLHVGINLHKLAPNFITSHATIKGLFEAVLNKQLPRNDNQDYVEFNSNELVYMTTKLTK